MKRKRGKIVYFGSGFNITVREIVFSVVIVLVMLTVGIFIHEKISSANDELNQEYYQAVKIEGDSELFRYGMRTNVGNAFVSGTLSAVDTVGYPEIDGEYAYIEKVKERYTQHTRTVTKTRIVNGKSQSYTTTETYWTWDVVDREDIHCEKITFLGVEFDYGKIPFPGSYELTKIKESPKIRYVYYVVDSEYDGTIYTSLKDNTVSDETTFHKGDSVSETVEDMVNGGVWKLILFWIAWVLLIILALYGFYYLDNKWLEDN